MKLSTLKKTWIFDLDGTLVEHNGYLRGEDQLLPGVMQVFNEIDEEDYVLILTARKETYREQTIAFLKKAGIRYNDILFGIPCGERILINDKKPSGLEMAYAVNVKRNQGIDFHIEIDEAL